MSLLIYLVIANTVPNVFQSDKCYCYWTKYFSGVEHNSPSPTYSVIFFNHCHLSENVVKRKFKSKYASKYFIFINKL